MESRSPRLRALARWIVLCSSRARARAVRALPRAEGLGIRPGRRAGLARAGGPSRAPRRRIRRPFGSQGRGPAAPRRRRRRASLGRSLALARRAFRRADRPQEATRSGRSETSPSSSWDWRYLFLFAVGLAFLAAGFARGPAAPRRRRESLVFAGFALSVALVLTLTPVPPVDGLFRAAVLLEDAARALFPALLLALVFTFPRRMRRTPVWLPFAPPRCFFSRRPPCTSGRRAATRPRR